MHFKVESFYIVRMIKILYNIDILDKRSKSIPLDVNDARKYLIYKQGGVNLCGDILIKKLVFSGPLNMIYLEVRGC